VDKEASLVKQVVWVLAGDEEEVSVMVGLAAGITRRDSEERRHPLMLVSRGPGRRRGNVQWVHFHPPRQRFVRYISVRARSTGRRTYSLISIARPPH
jgi:hypothetical protein